MAVKLEEGRKAELLAQSEFFISEFGQVNFKSFDLSKTYQGKIFRLSSATLKSLCEITGFTARFELPGVKAAYMDLYKTEGSIVFEIDRNTKPQDVSVRYTRERWAAESGKVAESSPSTIKTSYEAKFIPQPVLTAVAEKVGLTAEVSQCFSWRINFKDLSLALFCEEKYSEHFPSGSFATFFLPSEEMQAALSPVEVCHQSVEEQTLSLEPTESNSPFAQVRAGDHMNEVSNNEPAATIKEQESPAPAVIIEPAKSIPVAPAANKTVDTSNNLPQSSAKYATYSRSEIDHMLKVQTETITASLGSKISSQQRAFQEAVVQQEKSFSKLSDGFVSQFEKSRTKLEAAATQAQSTTKSELEVFRKDLAKELEQYRAHLNKTIVPVAKFIEEKNVKPAQSQKELAAKAVSSAPASKQLQVLVLANLLVLVAGVAILLAVIMPQSQKIEMLQQKVDEISKR